MGDGASARFAPEAVPAALHLHARECGQPGSQPPKTRPRGLRRLARLTRLWVIIRLEPAIRSLSVQTLVSRLGAIVALLVGVLIPAGYGIIGYFKEAGALTYKAELTAARAAQYIYAPDAPWKYDTDQLAAISEIRTPTAAPIVQRILDVHGGQMMEKGAGIAWPTFARQAPIHASGALVGTAEVSASLRPLLHEVAFVSLGSVMLAVAAYLAFCVLPLNVVNRTLRKFRAVGDRFRQQNMLLDAALENMGHGLAMFDAAGRVVIANDRYAQLYGIDPKLVRPGTTLREIVEHRKASGLYGDMSVDAAVKELLDRAALGEVSHLTNRLANGRVVGATVQPRADGGWVVTHQDITEREQLTMRLARQNELLRQREEQARAQNEQLDTALENMFQGLAMFDAQERIVIANDRFAKMYGHKNVRPGMTLREVLQHRVEAGLYTDMQVEDALRTMRERVSRGRLSHLTSRLGDGRTIVVSILPRADGGWVTTHQDITEREQLNAQLAQQNERLDAALKNMSHGLCMFDAQQRVVVANDRYGEIYGLTREQIKPGTTLREIVQHRIARGLYAGPNPEAYIQERLAIFNEASTRVQHLSNGRAVSITRTPMRSGGWVTTHEDVTEREKLKKRLEEQNEQLDAALNNMAHGLVMFDSQQRLLICNKLYAEMYGLTPEQAQPGKTARQILEYRIANGCNRADDPTTLIDDLLGQLERRTTDIHELADGRMISVRRRETGNGGNVVTHQDITEHERLKKQLEQRNVQLDAALNNMAQGLVMYDAQQCIVIANDRYAQMYGLTPEQVKPGTSLRQILQGRIANGQYPGKNVDDLMAEMHRHAEGSDTGHCVQELSDGRSIAISFQRMPGGGSLVTHQDITEQRRSEAKIVHMALHDSLTGLPNRVLLNERLEQALARARRGDLVAVHLLDLDHFKNVNDTLGHPGGDKLLKMVTERLTKLVRETDTVARMGGDEFAVLQVAPSQAGDATALALRIISAVSEPYFIDDSQVVIGTSVGIAMGPEDGTHPDQLIRNSDLALYRAKGDGRCTYRFFSPEMDAQTQARRELEQDLRKALPAGEFELYYQPVVNLDTGKISGVEALIRWRHPEKGLIAPGAFIPLAEEIGFIVPLGEWALRQACKTAAGWPDHIRISVNLSPLQFRNPGLVQFVVNALGSSGLSADRLELEITETTLLQESEATVSTLYQLRALGVRIALDDFGTGYSSLSYLQSFPFDKIKIDRTFVKDIGDETSANIVRAVTTMAKGLGMTTTAEGVETVEQYDTVRSEGCTEMQGFLFSKPLPARELEGLLKTASAAQAPESTDAGRAA